MAKRETEYNEYKMVSDEAMISSGVMASGSGGTAVGNPSVADQIAEFIGKSMAELLNRKDSLQREIATIDEQIAAVRQRLSSQLGEYLPSLPRLPRLPGFRKGGRPKGSGKKAAAKAADAKKTVEKKRGRRTFTPEQKAEQAEKMRASWAKRRSQEEPAKEATPLPGTPGGAVLRKGAGTLDGGG